MTDEEAETSLVRDALRQLADADDIWWRNYSVFRGMDPDARARWWRLAKVQAERGAPAMVALLTKVIELRLKG